jgi:ribosomal protein S18 acetylase RimI-like enzyme
VALQLRGAHAARGKVIYQDFRVEVGFYYSMIEVIYADEKYFKSFYDALATVAKERIYIEMLEPPRFEDVAAFQKGLIQKNGPIFYAVENEKVVGWADIFPEDNPRLAHRGSLGMGILPGYRNQGLGQKLLAKALERAKVFGLEKVELNVYTSNVNAVKLYRKMGFKEEGLIKKYRKLDSRYFDCLVMAIDLTE